MYYCDGDKKISLTPVTNTSRALSSIDFYQDENGHRVGVNNQLIVAFKESVDTNAILKSYNVAIISKLSPHSYLLKTTNKKETIDIANSLNELPEVLYAHPDFIKKRFKR